MISRVLTGTQPCLPSSNFTSSHSFIEPSSISTLEPSWMRKRSVLVSLGELFTVTEGAMMMAVSR